MGNLRPMATMEEWMREINRRVQLLERRRSRPFPDEDAVTLATAQLGAGDHVITLPEGTTVVSVNGQQITLRVS